MIQNSLDDERPLQLKVCPRCDYSLIGLPAVGACPECGRLYDQISVFLYGEPAGSRRRAWHNVPQGRGQMLARAIVVAFFVFVVWKSNRRFPFTSWIQIIFFAFPFLIALRRIFNDQGSGITQIKITPEGIAQGIRGFGPIPYEKADSAKVIPWQRIKSVRLKPLKNNRINLRTNLSFRWWELSSERVDANVTCTPREMDELSKRIELFRHYADAFE